MLVAVAAAAQLGSPAAPHQMTGPHGTTHPAEAGVRPVAGRRCSHGFIAALMQAQSGGSPAHMHASPLLCPQAAGHAHARKPSPRTPVSITMRDTSRSASRPPMRSMASTLPWKGGNLPPRPTPCCGVGAGGRFVAGMPLQGMAWHDACTCCTRKNRGKFSLLCAPPSPFTDRVERRLAAFQANRDRLAQASWRRGH